MSRYEVHVMDFDSGSGSIGPEVVIKNLSLVKARKICTRAARRGFNLYGGKITTENWGATGGTRGERYRMAAIRMN